jgi:hypothetical protein
MPALYVFFRMNHPEIFDSVELAGKVVAAIFFTGVVWAIYGIACLLSRTQECPNCGGKKVAKYLYGIPKITKGIERDVKAGRIMLGGISDKKDSPKWYCNECKHEW